MAKKQAATQGEEADEFYTHSDPQSIKYRAIGASIIVISCSLAWWLFLDHESKRYQSIESVVNEPVNVERFAIPPEVIQKQKDYKERRDLSNETEAKPVADKKPAKKLVKKPAKTPVEKTAAKKQAVASAKPPVKLKNKPKPAIQKTKTAPKIADAWVLQLGSFTDKKNAETLRKKLYKSDISAYIKRFTVDGRKIYRVIVGPKLDRHSIEKMQSRVRRKSGIQPLIVKFKTGFEE